MPVRKISVRDRRAADPDYLKLKEQLVAEWKEQPGGSYVHPSPEIIEEETKPGQIEAVYVVWDAWAKMEDQVRSELIVEAFREARGEENLKDLMLAIGLTRSERARYSI